MVWDMECHDVHAADAARYITNEIEMEPFEIIGVLEHSIDMKHESGFMVLCSNNRLHFPGLYERMSLPVFIFHVLYGKPSGTCYVWSRLMMLRKVDHSTHSMIHRAFFKVGQWFADISSNPPVIDSAMMVGRFDLRIIVSRFAYLLRCATMSFQKYEKIVNLIMQPWTIHPIDPFWKDFKSVVDRADICIAVTPNNDLKISSFTINGSGMICCPMDKIIITSILLLSKEHAYVRKTRDYADKFICEHGVPKPLQSVIELLHRVITEPIEFPSHYAAPDQR